MLRVTAIAAAGLLLSACVMSRQYDQALDSPLTVAKDDILLSGHEDRKSLEVYQELSLVDVAEQYQEAMKDFPVK